MSTEALQEARARQGLALTMLEEALELGSERELLRVLGVDLVDQVGEEAGAEARRRVLPSETCEEKT